LQKLSDPSCRAPLALALGNDDFRPGNRSQLKTTSFRRFVTMANAVVVQTAMSFDGFMAGPEHEMDWVFDYAAADSLPELYEATGAMLSGRNSYDVGRRDTGKPSGEPYGGAWSGPMFTLTHDPPPDDDATTFLSGDIGDAVETAAQAAGDRNLVLLGADVSMQALDRGLVDELQILVLPVLLGDGIPLFATRRHERLELDPLSVRQSGQATLLHYRVKR
jgi:dihydrofolate reductase